MSEQSNADCIFCKIIAGEIPAAVIFEDDDVVAFCDAFPAEQGHALVVPKAHHPDVFALPEALVAKVNIAAQRLALAQRKALQPDGLLVTQFNGEAAGQTVFHYHVHCLPRWAGSDRATHGRAQANPDDLKAMAERIAAALD
ncbi:HIT family protein [Ectothiorhodospiraceae bacterium WFHF3C12]|nr:HIT family protein [Ectothiorhodospiraceae bacterium WFHF3C12]